MSSYYNLSGEKSVYLCYPSLTHEYISKDLQGAPLSTDCQKIVQKWSPMRILNTGEKIPRKQDKSLAISVSPKHRIVLRMYFCDHPRWSRLEEDY